MKLIAFIVGCYGTNEKSNLTWAMMALDRSPESFSQQMNSTSLFLWFQLVIPSFDPKGHHMNKIDKGLQGNAAY